MGSSNQDATERFVGLDWTQDGQPGFDEKVVREALDGKVWLGWITDFDGVRQYIVLRDKPSFRAYQNISGTEAITPEEAWKHAREKREVREWERLHNPSLQPQAGSEQRTAEEISCPQCGQQLEYAARHWRHVLTGFATCSDGQWVTDRIPPPRPHIEGYVPPPRPTGTRPVNAPEPPIPSADGNAGDRVSSALLDKLADETYWSGTAQLPTLQSVMDRELLQLRAQAEARVEDAEVPVRAPLPEPALTWSLEGSRARVKKEGGWTKTADYLALRDYANGILCALQSADKRIAALRSRDREIAEAHEWMAMLDWLVAREANLVTHREKNGDGGWFIWWTVLKRRKVLSGHPLGSPAEAIRAAMRYEQSRNPAQGGEEGKDA